MVVKKTKGYLIGNTVILEKNDYSDLLYQKHYGIKKQKNIELSLIEAIYLLLQKKLEVYNKNYKKKYSYEELLKKAKEKKFKEKLIVYSDLRKKGYIVKTALKYGTDFRVYDKGIKPVEDHSKWLLYVLNENEKINIKDYISKNRIAHSTRKKLLLAIVDDEQGITYYESSWIKP